MSDSDARAAHEDALEAQRAAADHEAERRAGTLADRWEVARDAAGPHRR